jgi:hypothetical protein
MQVMDVVERLHEAVGELLDVETAGLGDAELGGALVELARAEARLCAVRARLTAVFDRRRAYVDDGSKTAAAWLGRHCRLPRRAAKTQAGLGRRLRVMPVAAAALAAGEVGEAQARLLGAVCESPRAAVAAAFPLAEADLVELARTLPYEDFVKAVRYWEDLVDEDGAEDKAARDHAARRVHVSESLDGNFVLDGRLDPIGGTEVATALRRIERELFEADWNEATDLHGTGVRIEDLGRTPAQRRADALVEMARRAMAVPRGARLPEPLVTVVVGLETLTGRVCELFNRTPVTPGQVAGLLDKASVERVVFAGRNRVIEVGERERFFRGGLRRAIEVRDRGCRHPGCRLPAEECQVDHVVPYAAHGLTVQENGRLLCAFHNRTRHRRPRKHARAPVPGYADT